MIVEKVMIIFFFFGCVVFCIGIFLFFLLIGGICFFIFDRVLVWVFIIGKRELLGMYLGIKVICSLFSVYFGWSGRVEKMKRYDERGKKNEGEGNLVKKVKKKRWK